ncbi:hypothetical protein [Candidatus Liberibacter sp.]|nr:hypothetical protein [Candidatus Liberibacter sp.]
MNTLAQNHKICDRWRNHKNTTDNRHLSNAIEPHAVESLTKA